MDKAEKGTEGTFFEGKDYHYLVISNLGLFYAFNS